MCVFVPAVPIARGGGGGGEGSSPVVISFNINSLNGLHFGTPATEQSRLFYGSELTCCCF